MFCYDLRSFTPCPQMLFAVDIKLQHSYKQARARQGKPVNEVFDAIEEKHAQ